MCVHYYDYDVDKWIFIIIIIGKIDQSSAGAAYDSLVNQLLTLLDGLR